jgi:aspartate aminotransferase-like enzyme
MRNSSVQTYFGPSAALQPLPVPPAMDVALLPTPLPVAEAGRDPIASAKREPTEKGPMHQTLFTVGPVQMYPESLRIASQQIPYFRTEEFSQTVLECEKMMCALAAAPTGSRMILLTASGTGAMEAAVLNLLGPEDRALIVVGGGFGQRFCDICEDHGIPYDAIRLEPGQSIKPARIDALELENYKALLVNAHETSTGVLYDLDRLGAACRRSGTFFIVDAISAFLCDPIDMAGLGIDLFMTGSQKALALAPGLSILILGPRALEDVKRRKIRSHYFAFPRYLADAERGQTPFTPAVGVILQLHERLNSIMAVGAAELTRRCSALAMHFRASINGLPFAVFPDSPSNALTALTPTNGASAYDIYSTLKSRFCLVVTPNGGALRDKVFRVGHMGNLAKSDMDVLATALKEISK